MRGVLRTVEVLRALNEHNGARVAELHRATGIPRPSIYRVLETLFSCGYVRKRDNERYELTARIRALSSGFKDEDWIREIGLPVLQELQQEIVWPTDIVVFDDDAIVLVETTRRQSPLTIDKFRPGVRLPVLRSATGRAYLAFCLEAERQAILARVAAARGPESARARDRRYVAGLIARTRASGYGEQHGEIDPKVAGIAVPVASGGRVVACLNITFISSALTCAEAAKRYLGSLKRSARRIEERLTRQGYL
ncbi:MAG: helix-turn-helix domain-containing protein [Burkholderiales bacterium]|nr:helix-turn-helix domain-containing protein [Burkholderiales bacterium]